MKKWCLSLLILWCLLVVLLSVTRYTWSASKEVPHSLALIQPYLNISLQSTTHSINKHSLHNITSTRNTRIPSVIDFCNLPGKKRTQSLEGKINEGYTLVGVITVFRHGDRGPLTQLKSKTTVNCSSHATDLYLMYERDVKNLGSKGILEKLIPTSDFCQPGLLTKQGCSQLLELGLILRNSYANYVNFTNSTDFSNIDAFTTPYSRTIQSMYALLYGMLGPMSLLRVKIQSKSQVSFCFKHCHCSATSGLEKLHKQELVQRLSRDPYFKYNFSEELRPLKSEMRKPSSVELPSTIRDIALVYICHNLSFPWFGNGNNFHAQTLLDALNLEARTSSSGIKLKQAAILRSYGIFSYINKKIEQWTSQRNSPDNLKQLKPMFLFFSGHDLTLMYMLAALGIYDGFLPNYASRITFEVLQNRSNYYVRILYDGKDVSSLVCAPELAVYCQAKFLITMLESSLNLYSGTPYFRKACEG